MNKILLPYAMAKHHRLVVLPGEDSDQPDLVACRGVKPDSIVEARRVIGRQTTLRFVSDDEFQAVLDLVYNQKDGHAAQVMDDVAQDMDLKSLTDDLPIISDLMEMEDDAPIIRLINALLTQAMKESASDIHVEIFESRSVVRLRIDGGLHDVLEPPRALHAAIVSRIKIMAQLDIAEKRLPQDGRISLRIGGRPVDVRVSTLPSAHGERVVLRLLDKQSGRLNLGKLGMNTDTLQKLDRLVHQPHGIVLVTGPTGSGKTTTLYAALSQLDTRDLNIMTVEDPIEYDLDGVAQTQVNPRIDMSFSRALRAILRQDPDIVMIGEIRDLETAQIAVQASLTGHLVLATLHTNDAPSAVTRLIDMGVEPFLLASSLLGVLAQRLVRKLCPKCSNLYTPDTRDKTAIGLPVNFSGQFRSANGCVECNHRGYNGRTGVHEILVVDAALRKMIHDGQSEQALRTRAMENGMIGLREDAARHVMAGTTTLEEALRVTKDENL
jgi:general secretion pathway protein E